MTRRPVVRRLARTLALALAVCGAWLLIVTFTPLLAWWSTALAGPWEDPHGDVLIVLGGSVIQDGMIGESSYWRAVYAIRVWREGGFRELVISGDAMVTEPMRALIVSQGVPASAVRLEGRSRNTRENALYTAELLRQAPGRKVLLTSDYHMFRAHRAFGKAGLEVLPRPFPDARKRVSSLSARWGIFWELALETAKVAYYRAQGWI